MKRFKLSILATINAVILAGISLLGSACTFTPNSTSTDSSVDEKLSQSPDYSTYTRQFDSYAYSGPTDGTWTVDGELFSVGEDFRTVERYKEYKEAGFSILLAQSSIIIDFSTTVESFAATYLPIMDAAHEAGLKIILTDSRIQNLSEPFNVTYTKESVTIKDNKSWWADANGDTLKYTTDDELDAQIAEWMSLYKDHPAFYGIMLGDEPTWHNAEQYGKVYKSVKRVMPECFVQYNLLPMQTDIYSVNARYPEIEGLTGTDEEQAAARYEKYIRSFVDSTGADYVQYDDYPMQAGKISSTYLRCMQIVAEICKEKDIEFRFVAQTFAMYNNGNLTFRAINEEEARWLNNTMLGFGVKQISYFTYWTKQANVTTGESYIDGASFITRAGHKTDLYYFMQEIMAENQKFAPTLLNFDYQGSRVYEKLPCNFDNRQTQMMKNNYTFKKVETVSINKECALITELFDKENSRYMYMVMNTVSPENKGSKAFQTTEITFSEEYTHVVVYKNGVGTPKKLDGNKITVKLAAGEAVYLLPY